MLPPWKLRKTDEYEYFLHLTISLKILEGLLAIIGLIDPQREWGLLEKFASRSNLWFATLVIFLDDSMTFIYGACVVS